jgi:hypothetical protein
MRITLFFALLGMCACGSSVVVDGESQDGDPSFADLIPGPSGDGHGDPLCTACAEGDCGWCDYEGGLEAFRCRGDRTPPSALSCVATGSVYHDEGGSYICWRCDG